MKTVTFFDALRVVAAVAAVTIGLYFVYRIADILLLFLAAVIFAIALDRPLDALVRRNVPRAVAAVMIYTTFLVVSVTIMAFTVPPLVQEVRNFGNNFSGLVSDIETSALGEITADDAVATEVMTYSQSVSELLQSSSQFVIDTALRVYGGFLTFLIIFFLSLFLNIQRDGVKQFVTVFVPMVHRAYALGLYSRIQQRVSSWLWGKTVSSLFVASVVFVGLVLLGVPYAVTFTVLAFLLNYIPFAGPFMAGILPTLLAFAISPLHAIGVVFLYFLANTIEGFVVIPFLLKQSIQLNPLLLIFAVLVGGRFGGLLGILLSIPVVAILTLLYEEYHQKRYRE